MSDLILVAHDAVNGSRLLLGHDGLKCGRPRTVPTAEQLQNLLGLGVLKEGRLRFDVAQDLRSGARPCPREKDLPNRLFDQSTGENTRVTRQQRRQLRVHNLNRLSPLEEAVY